MVLRQVQRRAEETEITIDFFGLSQKFSVPVVHRLHVENALAAILIARQLGMKQAEIQEACRCLIPLAGRGTLSRQKGFTIIDETYNSNPEALKRTLAWLDQEFSVPKVAVLGDMLELGEGEERFHRQVGRFLAGLHFDLLVTVGLRARQIAAGAKKAGFPQRRIREFSQPEEAGAYLKEAVAAGAVLLFKASRGIGLENGLEAFLK